MTMMAMSAAFGVARAQGTWSTAQLSLARTEFAATSVGNVALFAGGYFGGALLCRDGGGEVGCLWLRAFFSAVVRATLTPIY